MQLKNKTQCFTTLSTRKISTHYLNIILFKCVLFTKLHYKYQFSGKRDEMSVSYVSDTDLRSINAHNSVCNNKNRSTNRIATLFFKIKKEQ